MSTPDTVTTDQPTGTAPPGTAAAGGAEAGGVEAALVEVLGRHLRRGPQDGDWAGAVLSDLGLDSMTAIELVVDIEETFDVEFPEELLVRETFATFGALAGVVRSMVSES